jgi:enolase-phosphatase E1
VTVSASALHTRALLLDIEGTTTPIEFVYNVLFPYARTHAAAYLQREGESAAGRAAVDQLRAEQAADRERGDHPPALILDYFAWLMDRDKKSPGLKSLQGLIWQDGYKSGELRGQVYPDVAPAFERWRARRLDIYIYSSGSVLAQQLLFGSTDAGDLTKFLNGYFDTAVGRKTSPDSYLTIGTRIEVPPPEILFVSDVVQELDAARTSGMRTALCIRGEGVPSGSESHPVIRSFDEIGS